MINIFLNNVCNMCYLKALLVEVRSYVYFIIFFISYVITNYAMGEDHASNEFFTCDW